LRIPDHLKHRLMKRIAHTNGRLQKRWRPGKVFSGFGLAALTVLVLVVIQMQPLTHQANYTAVQQNISDQDTFLYDPRTIQYDVTSATPTSIRGGVWVNDTTKEML